jgi:hypothetical protein
MTGPSKLSNDAGMAVFRMFLRQLWSKPCKR